jgi:cytochrome b561
MQSPSSYAYSPVARTLHWLTVLALAIQLPVGVLMVNVKDFPGFFYSGHKVFGLVILALVIVRLGYRLVHGAPPDEPTLNTFEKIASHLTHWSLYGLLLVVAFLGWLGISTYDAREVFGFTIPSIAAKDEAFAERVFQWHKIGAIALFLMAGMHVGAALMHYVIKKDGVMARMLPGAGRRS